jgi:hypothetical protein
MYKLGNLKKQIQIKYLFDIKENILYTVNTSFYNYIFIC